MGGLLKGLLRRSVAMQGGALVGSMHLACNWALPRMLPLPLECSARVCVYHQMFCEATVHGEHLVRHPANTWSNVGFIGVACFVLQRCWATPPPRPEASLSRDASTDAKKRNCCQVSESSC